MSNRKLSSKIIAGSIALVFIIGINLIGYFLGYFGSNFGNNMCYSEVISKISSHSIALSETTNQDLKSKLKNKLESLPLQGYETNCNELLEHLTDNEI